MQEAVSSMIKELRRGRELDAMYWAAQIERRYHKYVWRRLVIFAAEDVGVANPIALMVTYGAWQAYERVRKEQKNRSDKDILAMVVLMLARSDKSRESNLTWAMMSSCMEFGWKPLVQPGEPEAMLEMVDDLERLGWQALVPEYALDGHTKRGKIDWPVPSDRHRNWFTIWSKVEPDVGYLDVKVWQFRRMAGRGLLDKGQVESWAAKMLEQGRLRWGANPPYPDPYAVGEAEKG